MNQYKHLLAFDLSSYGAAYAIMNQFVDDENIKVFEVSPSGSSAILILLSNDLISLQVIKSEAFSFFKDLVLSSELIENIQTDVLMAYLSQNSVNLKKSAVILESNSLSNTIRLAQKACLDKLTIVDFRVVRTHPKNVILILTGESVLEFSRTQSEEFKKTVLDTINPIVKSYFEV